MVYWSLLALLLAAAPCLSAFADEPAAPIQKEMLDLVDRAEVGEGAREAFLALAEEAILSGLPVEPMLAKFLEGVAKGVAEARVLAAVRAVHSRLVRAGEALEDAVREGAEGPIVGADIARVSAGLSAGVPPEQVALLARSAAEARVPVSRVVAAVATLERLRGMGVYDDRAAEALAAALLDGMPEVDLRRMAEDYRRHARAGGDAGTFFGGEAEAWGREGLSGTGISHDAAGRLDAGRLPDESGVGESVVPGTEHLSRGSREEDDHYDRDRDDPRDDFIPDRPDEDDEPPDTPDPPDHPSGS